MTRSELRAAARKILSAGLAAVEPGRLVRSNLVVEGRDIKAGGIKVTNPGRIFMVSVGKAAAAMARAAHLALEGRVSAAIVIAPQKAPRMKHTQNFVAGHPIPDAEGVRAAKQVVQLLERAGRGDLVLLLLSGGASALMPAPIAGVSLRDKQRLTRMLLRRGASITEINAVRKRLSRLKGGRFTALGAPARVVTLVLSDVPGDDIGTIGSGPTVVDPKARTLALRTVRRFLWEDYGSAAVREALARPNSVRHPAKRTGVVVIGNGRTFARAAAKKARGLGFRTVLLPDALQGEARRRGPWLVKRFASYRRRVPLCLIATGETVVKVRGRGRGGRNQELALAAVPALGRLGRATLLAAFATDGRDGASLASGGLVDDRTQQRARAQGVSVEASLDRNDSNAALERLGALITCGPTRTNVADVTLVLG